jgi:hypothetical protein
MNLQSLGHVMKGAGLEQLRGRNALGRTRYKTAARFERNEARRGGYAATEEFRLFAGELLGPLTDKIRERLANPNGTNEKALVSILGQLDPGVIAIAGLVSLLPAIQAGRDIVKQTLGIGRAIHGELWAANLLSERPHIWLEIYRAKKAKDRSIKAKASGYNSREWDRPQLWRVGNWFEDCCQQALPDYFITVVDPEYGRVLYLTKAGAAKGLSYGSTHCGRILFGSRAPSGRSRGSDSAMVAMVTSGQGRLPVSSALKATRILKRR